MMDSAKLLADSSAVAQRYALLHASHVASLTAFVHALRLKTGRGTSIPFFDPWDGGVSARVLFLLEAPGPKAVTSGFISRNNPDETAKNFFELNMQAGLDRRETVSWNNVPWYLGSGTKIRPANRSDINEGLTALPDLLSLLPRLQIIVLLGRKAERTRNQVQTYAPDITLITCPHPSPLYVNNAPGNRTNILTVLQDVSERLHTFNSSIV